MTNPYTNLPASRFWRSAMLSGDPYKDLYYPKFTLAQSTKIATAGSCFAQHIGRNLKARNFSVLDVEPPPHGLGTADQFSFGYGMFSARYGNIYTTRQLLQLANEVYGRVSPAVPIWRNAIGNYVDAQRPAVEPEGLDSALEVANHRKFHLERVRTLFEEMDVFIFTLGLTEVWAHRESGTVFPMAPGTIAGEYDPDIYQMLNLRHSETLEDFLAFRNLLSEVRPQRPVKFILTVSPVPLTATASNLHVMSATMHSKSVLRAVAGELYRDLDDVDYFPSFEIVTNPWSAQVDFEENLRTVRTSSVENVMRVFFTAHASSHGNSTISTPSCIAEDASIPSPDSSHDDVICEESILAAFAKP